MKTWQTAAEAHARAAYAQGRYEACGLVIEADGGRQLYQVCANTHESPQMDFRIAAAEFAAAEQLGQVVAVFHSHPDASCHPSEADRVACEASGLPFYILGLPDGVWGSCEPCGYVLPYEGRAFVHGVIDCYSIIRDWYQRERGIELPDFARRHDWWVKDAEGRCEDLYEQNFRAAGFEPIDARQARTGDVILMQVAATVPNHGAVLVDAARNHILHHVHGRLSEVTVYGGYWRAATRRFLRHQCAK